MFCLVLSGIAHTGGKRPAGAIPEVPLKRAKKVDDKV